MGRWNNQSGVPEGIVFDLCVIGAGPVGLMAAFAAVQLGLKVIVLERGGKAPLARLFDRSATADAPYPDPASTRSTALGGTSWRWRLLTPTGGFGARVAVEPAIFERRVDSIPSWDLSYGELRPSVERALSALGGGLSVSQLEPQVADQGALRSTHWGFTTSTAVRAMRGAVETTGLATVLTETEAVSLEMSGETVVSAMIRRSGTHEPVERVSARRFVLAGSTIDNCRLLHALQSDNPGFSPLDGLGRGICDHPRFVGRSVVSDGLSAALSGALAERPPRQFRFEPSLSLLNEGLPSASLTFVPAASGGPSRRVGALYSKSTSLVDNMLTIHAPDRVSNALVPLLHSSAPRVGKALNGMGGFEFDTDHVPPAKSFGSNAGASLAYVMAEQLPDERNFLTFERYEGGKTSSAHISWGAPHDPATTLATLDRMGDEMSAAGLGSKPEWQPAVTAHSSHHLSGGTATGGRYAVADRWGRVLGTSNLGVAGVSTFPSAGHVNPVLQAMATADLTARSLCADLTQSTSSR